MNQTIQVFAAAHWTEITLFAMSLLATPLWAVLLVLKIRDIKKNKTNGPILFMLNDNRRFGIWFFSLSALFLYLSCSALTNPPDKHDYEWFQQSRDFVVGMNAAAFGLVVESLYRFRRRAKMAVLVAEYEAEQEQITPLAGGSRSYDPPKDGDISAETA